MIERAHARPSQAGQRHTDPLDYIEVLRDRRAINERFAELQEDIKRRDPRLHEAAVRDAAAGERRRGSRSRRSTSARSVYELSIFDDPERPRASAGSSTPARTRASSRSCRSSW